MLINTKSNDFYLWKEIDELISKTIGQYTEIYIEHCIKTIDDFSYHIFQDKGYTIYKYHKNTGFQNFEHNFEWNHLGAAIISFIFFLNTIEEDGEVEFINGVKISPKKGNLIFFPATWDIMYKHNISYNFDKYIIAGKLYYNQK